MNDEKYKKFFYHKENLENVYNILKGDSKYLKKEGVRNLIQDFEGVEYEEFKDESNNKILTNNFNEDNENNNEGNDEKSSSDIISLEEFCSIFQKIYENSQNPEKIFLEGYCYMDKNK